MWQISGIVLEMFLLSHAIFSADQRSQILTGRGRGWPKNQLAVQSWRLEKVWRLRKVNLINAALLCPVLHLVEHFLDHGAVYLGDKSASTYSNCL